MKESNTLLQILNQAKIFFSPFADNISVDIPFGFINYCEYLDFDFTESDLDNKKLNLLIENINQLYNTLRTAIEENELDNEKLFSLILNLKKLFDNILNLKKISIDLDFEELSVKIIDDLILTYLQYNHHLLFDIGLIIGFIKQGKEQTSLEWNSFQPFFKDPLDSIKKNISWGTSDFNFNKNILLFKSLLNDVYVFSYFLDKSKKQLALSSQDGLVISDDSTNFVLQIPIFTFLQNNAYQELGFSISQSEESNNTSQFFIYLYGIAGFSKELSFKDGWRILLKSNISSTDDFGFKVNSNGAEIKTLDFSSIPKMNFKFELFKNLKNKTKIFNILGSVLSFNGYGFKIIIDIIDGKIEPSVVFSLNNMEFLFNSQGGDSFVTGNIPSDENSINFDLGIGFSPSRGVFFEGGSDLELNIPLHLELGPIQINNLMLIAKLSDNGLPLTMSADIKASLGPLGIVIENIGLAASFEFYGFEKENINKGNAGPLDIDFSFKPPNGIGLSIDATAVKGGGYLYIDTEKGLYYGAAELSIKETVNVTAVGIINTKLPDGSEGYSFLLLISAEFTPIQLGMGFTLSGVGGLVGIHRGMIIEAIASGVKNNTLDHILYPENPVANAPAIVASLNSFFPIQQDQFTFGIMLKLGWGTPNLVDIELGLIISLPDPIKIAIVGILKLVLPDAKAPVVKLQVNFIGAIDFGEKYFFFYATLFDSELLIFKVEGSMYFSIEWGSQPYFVFTIGGFHPTFKAPKLRGGIAQEDIKRLQLRLLESDNPKILLEFYFAVTSNTVQFGAALDFKLDLEIFKVLGWFYFDALFQFNPFYFNIQLSAGLQVFIGDSPILGIAFKGILEGPTPWRIQGYARFSFWFITAEVKINETFGEAPKDLIEPSVEALPILVKALKADGNWQLIKYKSYSDTVLTRGVVVVQEKEDVDTDSATDKTASALIAHPDARVIISQTKIPLNQNIDKIGEQKVLDFSYFKIEADIDGDNIPDNLGTTEDFFAISQYKALTNEEKLTKSSFELMDSGLEMSSDKLSTGDDTVCTELEYEMQIIDTHGFVENKQTQKLSAFLYNDFTLQNAIHTSVIGKANTLAKLDLIKTATIKKPIPVKDKFHNYSIVDRFDLANAKPITLTAFELAIHEH